MRSSTRRCTRRAPCSTSSPTCGCCEATGDAIKAQSNYLLLQTLVDGPTTIQQSGRYYDTFVRANGRLLLKERQCIYDTVLIANDLVLPV